MSKQIHKSHNVSVILYHIVCPTKYRRIVFSVDVDIVLKSICLEISQRYEIAFIEIGTDENHVHFLVQSVPMYSPKKIVQTIKSITAKEIFMNCPEVKEKLWGGEFWSDGYYVNSVGQHGSEKTVQEYVKGQGLEYKQLHVQQLQLF
jgi:REP element-mobilizing transposase RayT